MANATTLPIVDYRLQANDSTHLMNQTVELHGLKQVAMNGQRGVAKGYNCDTGRRAVQLLNDDDDRELAIKPENLRLIDSDGRHEPRLQ